MDKFELINAICPLPQPSAQRLAGLFAEVRHPKGYRLIQEGRVERNIYFVRRGIVRAYVQAKGREITFWIGAEGTVVMSLKSYVGDGSGYETIECVEDCDLYVLPSPALQALYREDIHLANWGRHLAEQEFLRTEERLIPQLFTTAAERYAALLRHQPALLQRIPLEHLASYLGITPVSLSRIRRQIK